MNKSLFITVFLLVLIFNIEFSFAQNESKEDNVNSSTSSVDITTCIPKLCDELALVGTRIVACEDELSSLNKLKKNKRKEKINKLDNEIAELEKAINQLITNFSIIENNINNNPEVKKYLKKFLMKLS